MTAAGGPQGLDRAQDAARAERERREARSRTLRRVLPILVSVLVLAIVGAVIAVVALQPKDPAPVGARMTVSGPRNMESLGVRLVGRDGGVVVVRTPALDRGSAPREAPRASGTRQIVEYLDLSCPACRIFEQRTLDWTLGEVAAGRATLELRPIAILGASYRGSGYSTRINAAAASIADRDPARFLAFVRAAYAAQPAESTAGLTAEQIVALAEKAGVTDAAVLRDIRAERWAGWVDAATKHALAADRIPVGTPTVYVDEHYYAAQRFTLAEFRAFYRDPESLGT